ncbi:hypothetical protein D083_2925 [Dickeya solani RNS 08.23.3.1.A]|nr:hypothetical protein D083_2925 [Dickeya solani RNS 08.23.3.1.A]
MNNKSTSPILTLRHAAPKGRAPEMSRETRPTHLQPEV